jgi:hypothetical protein
MATPKLSDLMKMRESQQAELNRVSSPLSQSEAMGYVSGKLDNFRPLVEERRALETQANQILPEQITQYTGQRSLGGQSPLSALNTILKNRYNALGSSNVVGDVITNAQGRLGDIVNSGLQMRQQDMDRLKYNIGITQNDIQTEQARIEADRSRAAARAAAQASQFRPPQFNTNQAKQGAVDPTQQALNDLFNAYSGKQALTPEEINKMFGINKNNQPTPPTLLDSLGRIMNQQANLSKAQAQSRLNQLAQQFPAQSQQISNVLKFFGR